MLFQVEKKLKSISCLFYFYGLLTTCRNDDDECCVCEKCEVEHACLHNTWGTKEEKTEKTFHHLSRLRDYFYGTRMLMMMMKYYGKQTVEIECTVK